MKDRREKMIEYEMQYAHIPKDYKQRLQWLHDELNIGKTMENQILRARQQFIETTYYETLRMVFYEVPSFTPRPRAHIISKKGIMNAIGTNQFIVMHSTTGRANREFMQLYKQEHLSQLEQLLCTPCDFELRAYFPTPKSYNKLQVFLAEIGLDRPINKPDFDNILKCYADSFTGNVWIDDIIVVDATFRKYYSVLPRVEIDLKYMNQLYNQHQYKAMIKRKDYDRSSNVTYFGE